MPEADAHAAPPDAGSRHKVRARSGRLRWSSVAEVESGMVTLAFDGYPPKFNERLSLEEFRRRRQAGGDEASVTATASKPSRGLVERIKVQAAESARCYVRDLQAWRPVDGREVLEWLTVAAMWAATLLGAGDALVGTTRGGCVEFFDEVIGEHVPAFLNRFRLIVSFSLAMLAAPVATLCLLSARSDYLRSVAYLTVFVWVKVFSAAVYDRFACTGQTHEGESRFFLALNRVAALVEFAQVFRLFTKGLGNLELSLLRPVGMRRIRWVLAALSVQYAGLLVFGGASLWWGVYALRFAFGACGWAALVLIVCYVALIIRALGCARQLLGVVAREAGGLIRMEAQMARRSVALQMCAAGLCLLTSALVLVGTLLSLGDGYSWPMGVLDDHPGRRYLANNQAPGWVDSVSNLVGALILFHGAFGAGIAARRARARLGRRRRETSRAYHQSGMRRNAEWDEKVRELAGRGFSLRELLHFYRGLGSDYMRHFTPAVHTTEDVARQAIIPLSSSNQCAYAEIMMKGIHTRPNKMVTHSWGNLFRDLVACIAAEALGENEYKMVAQLLDVDVGQVESWLRAAGKLDTTYWVCAFSVSQHDSICNTNPGNKRDPVTNAVHPTCPCGKPKTLNDSPPCTADGRSIGCEMNKFDDMMEYLAATDPKFELLIAVDSDFVLFSRAWCIAEIVEAHAMGMQHQLTIESMESLNMHTKGLRDLRVEDMHASRQEDKDYILGKIPDKRRFNESLQLLIFRVILPRWQNLDVQEKMFQIGRLSRWASLPDDKASVAFSP